MLTKAKLRKFNISDWLPVLQAYVRVRESWGSQTLAEDELLQLLLDDRLISAMVVSGETEQRHFFPMPGFWQRRRLRFDGFDGDSVRIVEPHAGGFTWEPFKSGDGIPCGALYIRRAELDALYPPAKQPAQAEADTPKGRPPGRPTKYDWHTICGEIAARCIDPKTQKLKIPKNQSKLAEEVLQLYRDGGPSMTEMQEAVRLVLAVLRRL
jgi:hypothetical protein